MHRVLTVLFGLLIAVNLSYVFSGAWHLPLENMDAVGIWLLKAKAWYLEGGLPYDLLRNPQAHHSHPQYPLLLPFMISRLYLLLGEVNERAALLLYPLIYLVSVCVVYRVGRSLQLPRLFSLSGAYLYSMLSPVLAQGGRGHAGNADLLLALGGWLMVWGLSRQRSARPATRRNYWWLVPLVMVLSQLKTEGLFWSLVFWWLPLPKNQRLIGFVLAILPGVAWQLFVQSQAIPTDLSLQLYPLPVLLTRVLEVTAGFAVEMANWRNWYWTWPLVWLSLGLGKPLNRPLEQLLIKLGLSLAVAFFVIYLWSSLEATAYVRSSADRVLLQLSPIWFSLWLSRSYQLLSSFVQQSLANTRTNPKDLQ